MGFKHVGGRVIYHHAMLKERARGKSGELGTRQETNMPSYNTRVGNDLDLTTYEVALLWQTTPKNVRRFLRRYHADMQTRVGMWRMDLRTARQLHEEFESHRRHAGAA